MTAVIGVDPGVNGGVAVLGDGYQQVWALHPTMLEVELDILMAEVQAYAALAGARTAFVEKVQHMTGDGGKGSHTFGYVKGFLRGELRARGFLICDVYPMIWQAAMGCLSQGNKNVTKAAARLLFPQVKVTHNIADALLIAEYGRRQLLAKGST